MRLKLVYRFPESNRSRSLHIVESVNYLQRSQEFSECSWRFAGPLLQSLKCKHSSQSWDLCVQRLVMNVIEGFWEKAKLRRSLKDGKLSYCERKAGIWIIEIIMSGEKRAKKFSNPSNSLIKVKDVEENLEYPWHERASNF